MQPKDFSKRKFKMIPGADYSDGPISKYGTFGNMLRQRAITGLKKSADNIPMSAADLTGENIEQITDFINPISGMIKAVDKPLTEFTSSFAKDALGKYVDRGDPTWFAAMPKMARQELTDKLTSSRSMKEPYPLGMTGNQSKNDIGYFGMTTKMKPGDFLGLAAERNDGMFDAGKAENFTKHMLDSIVSKNKERVAPPFLQLEEVEDGLQVVGHEGRHRSDMLGNFLGYDVDIPVDIFVKGQRRRNLNQDTLDLPLTNEDGYKTKKTLRSMLPEGFDTSALQAAE